MTKQPEALRLVHEYGPTVGKTVLQQWSLDAVVELICQHCRIIELEARIAELEVDAVRYRSLRERVGSTATGELYLYVSSRKDVRESMQDLMAQLDANIDATITAQSHNGEQNTTENNISDSQS